jgi:O-antigen/teichoic acid export membrane protein
MSETLVAKWAELVTQGLLFLVVPRVLGPDAYGQFAVAFATVSLVSIGLGLGAPLAAIRYVPAATPEQRRGRARAVAASTAASRARVLAALTVVALAIAPPLLDVPLAVMLAVCAAAWCSVASSVVSELSFALGRTKVWNARFPLENALVVAAVPAGYAAGGSDGAIYGLAAATAAALALLSPGLVGDLRGAPRTGGLPAAAAAYARIQTVSVVLSAVVLRGGPLAMVLAGEPSAAIAYAAIATGVGAAGATSMMSLLGVQLPRLVSQAREGTKDDARRSAWAAIAIALAAAVPAALLAEPALELALGDEFAPARDAVVLALPSVPLGAALGHLWLLTNLGLRLRALAAGWTAGAVAFAAVAALTIPALDARGASIALSCGLLAATVTIAGLLGDRAVRATTSAAVLGAVAVLGAGAAAGGL